MPNVFQPLLDFIDRLRGRNHEGEDGPNLFQLSEKDIETLKAFVNSDEYDALCRAIDGATNLYAEQLIAESDTAEVHRLRGVIFGLRNVPLTLNRIIQQEDALHAREREREDREADERARARNRITFGSPSWRRNGSG